MESILGVIITYNPDITRLKKNILAIHSQIQGLIIIDNFSINIAEIEELSRENNVTLIKNNCNKGIGFALNQALFFSKQNEYSWLLTLDQDSICSEQMINKMIDFYEINNRSDEIVILAPEIVEDNGLEIGRGNTGKVRTVITSGSLNKVQYLIEIGGFNDMLFIDHVDFDLCLRVKKEIYIVKDAFLYHQLGEKKSSNFFWKQVITTNHSYIRKYYYYRNLIYIVKSYIFIHPKWVLLKLLSSIKGLFKILLFEKEKLLKIKYIFKGIKDGICNKYGEIEN